MSSSISEDFIVSSRVSLRFQVFYCLLELVYVSYEVANRPRAAPTLILCASAFISFCIHAVAGAGFARQIMQMQKRACRNIHTVSDRWDASEARWLPFQIRLCPTTCAVAAFMVDVLLMTTGLAEVQRAVFHQSNTQPFVLFIPALGSPSIDTRSSLELYAWQRALVLNTVCTCSTFYIPASQRVFRPLFTSLLFYTGIVTYFKVSDVLPIILVVACQCTIASNSRNIRRFLCSCQGAKALNCDVHCLQASCQSAQGPNCHAHSLKASMRDGHGTISAESGCMGVQASGPIRSADAEVMQQDCLPMDTLVWVERGQHLQFLREVRPGERVLCFDHVIESTDFASVENVKMGTCRLDGWVTIRLQDGTEQVMTSAHLLQAQECDASGSWRSMPGPIEAADLQPGVHSVMVLKTVPVPVESVRPGHVIHSNAPSAMQAVDTVTLNLHNPVRYSVFVAPRVKSAVFVAVGSDNLSSHSRTSAAAARQRRGQQRAFSAPVFSGSTLPGVLEQDSTSISSLSSEEDVLILLAGVTARRSSSVLSDDEFSAPRARAKPGPHWNKTVSLQQTLRLAEHGIRSLGSLAHSLGTCSACVFETRYRRGSVMAPCRNGVLCDRCHEPHDTSNAGRRRRRSSASVSGGGPEEFTSGGSAGSNFQAALAGEFTSGGSAGSALQAGAEEIDMEDFKIHGEDHVRSL